MTETTVEQTDATGEHDVGERRRIPFGGLDPADAARRGHEVRRQRRLEREANAELDRLSALARAGVVAARELTVAEQSAILRAMVEKAKLGHVQHARFVLDWLVKLGASTDDDTPGDMLDPADMTPAQRAAARARLLAALRVEEEADAVAD